MKEREINHYVESTLYAMEQTAVYLRVKGAQLFNELNLGVTVDQFIVLDAIYCNNQMCQRDVSKIVLKDRSNTGRILTILDENGFITRALETKGNRPVKMIYITEKGKKLVEESIPKLRSAFHPLFDSVSDEEFIALRATLAKIKNSLSKTTNIQI